MNFDISSYGAIKGAFIFSLVMLVYDFFRPEAVNKIGNSEIYKYPFTDISVWFVVLVFEVLFFTRKILVFDVRGFVLAIMMFITLYYFMFILKYKVIIKDNKVSHGAFGKPHDFYLSDIADACVHSSGRRDWLMVSLRHGGKVRFSSYLSGFEELCERMKFAAKRK